MKRAALALLVLASGCDFRARAAAEARHLEMERTMAELDVRIERLERENEDLRAELAALKNAPLSPSSAAVSGTGPRCSGSGTSFSLKRADVDAIFTDTQSLASGARIVPSFENGVATGFKLFGIRPDSFYSSCGFMNGDVIKTINGNDLSSPDKALDAYTKMKGASRAAIEITRTGKPVVLTITVED